MPRLNQLGHAIQGVGGPVSIRLWGSVRAYEISPRGTCACWLDDQTAIYQVYRDERWYLETFNIVTGLTTEIDARGCNELAAGGGRWIAWQGTLFGSLGEIAAAGVSPTGTDGRGAAGRDGTMAVKLDRQSNGEVELVPPTGRLGDPGNARVQGAYGMHVLSPMEAIWTGSVPGLRPGAFSPQRAIARDGRTWWVYSCDQGLVAHPEKNWLGHIIQPDPVAFHYDSVVVDDALIVAYSRTVGEGPDDLEVLDAWKLSIVDLNMPVSVPIPTIGRPLWLCWFEFGDTWNPAPHNGELSTKDGILRDLSGRAFGQYVDAEKEGNTPEAYKVKIQEARKRNPTLPVVTYWPRGVQTKDYIPECEWVGVEAYCGVAESLLDFEQRIGKAIERCKRVALIAQCYTSNSNNTKDLQSLVPVYARLAKNHQKIHGILAFSNSGRATGLNDHPEVLPFWQKLFEGIPSAPAIVLIPKTTVPIIPITPIDEEDMPVESEEKLQERVDMAYAIGKNHNLQGFDNEELSKHAMKSGIGDKFRKPKSQGGPERNPTVFELIVGATYRFGTKEIKDEVLAELIPAAIAAQERLRR